jgi:aryl-alcohol dehydrogenase-like predicted oxidoreductase
MHYRPLGKTGIQVSEIGFGGWAIGGVAEVAGVATGWGRTSDDESLGALRRARDLGVNFFDTSDSYGYGRSESLFGIVLSRKKRDQAIIATKVGHVRTSSGEFRKDFSKRHIFFAIDASLRRLRTDYIDLYQVQNPPMSELENGEIQEAMEMLQSWGKIRFWGISAASPSDGIEAIRNGWGYTVQILFNVLNQAAADELFPSAMERGFGVIARVPLASGLLTGKYRGNSVFPLNDVRRNFLTARRLEEVVERIDEVKGAIGGSARSLGEAALRFVLSFDAVSTTIPGAKSQYHVEQNVEASGNPLPEDVVARLRQRLGDYNFYLRHQIRL